MHESNDMQNSDEGAEDRYHESTEDRYHALVLRLLEGEVESRRELTAAVNTMGKSITDKLDRHLNSVFWLISILIVALVALAGVQGFGVAGPDGWRVGAVDVEVDEQPDEQTSVLN